YEVAMSLQNLIPQNRDLCEGLSIRIRRRLRAILPDAEVAECYWDAISLALDTPLRFERARRSLHAIAEAECMPKKMSQAPSCQLLMAYCFSSEFESDV